MNRLSYETATSHNNFTHAHVQMAFLTSNLSKAKEIKSKGPELVIALLTWVGPISRSTLQKNLEEELIGMS